MPPRETRSVTRSRVVPGVAVTMARSRSTQAIEERGLAGVGPADDGHGESVVHDAALAKGCDDGRERRFERNDAPRDLGIGRDVYVVFREVDAGFEQRDEVRRAALCWARCGG